MPSETSRFLAFNSLAQTEVQPSPDSWTIELPSAVAESPTMESSIIIVGTGVCVCVVIPFILEDVRLLFVDAPAGITQAEGHTGFIHLPSAVVAFSRERDSAVHFPRRQGSRRLCTKDLIVLHLLGFYFILFILFFVRKNPSSCDDTEIRTHIPTSEGFEVTN